MDLQKFNILLVEDDENLSIVLEDYLEMLGYKIVLCRDGEEGIEAFNKYPFDLCILDVMLPKKDGFALAGEIRRINLDTPIIFLTAKSLKDDRIKGFLVGCDDYITKPFSTEELSLRIKAILKRCLNKNQPGGFSGDGCYQIGIFTFDFINMILSAEKSVINLTKKEAALLKILFEYKNQLLPRDIAMKRVWGSNDYFIGRSMDVFIAKLRKYLKTDPGISITNVHGAGFKLEVFE